MSRRKYSVVGAIAALVVGAAVAFWFISNQKVEAQTGPFDANRHCYLTGYRAGGEKGEKPLTSATTTQVTITNGATEATSSLSSTLVCNITGVDAWNMKGLAMSTTSPNSTLLVTVEYSDCSRNDIATTTEEECDWFEGRYGDNRTNTTAATSTLQHGLTLHRIEPFNNPTTTFEFLGDSGVFHKWMRLTFKSAGAASMKLWVDVTLREPKLR